MSQLCGLAAPWNGDLTHVWMWCGLAADHAGDHKVRLSGQMYRWPAATTPEEGTGTRRTDSVPSSGSPPANDQQRPVQAQ